MAAARILDGNAFAKGIRERIGKIIVEKQKLNSRYKPCLKIIQGIYSPSKYQRYLCEQFD